MIDKWRTDPPFSEAEPFHGPHQKLFLRGTPGEAEASRAERLAEAKATRPVFALVINMAIHVAIDEMRWWDPDRRRELGRSLVDVLAGEAGAYLEGLNRNEKERRMTVQAFSAVARGVAALAYQPGGVTFLGTHYEGKQ